MAPRTAATARTLAASYIVATAVLAGIATAVDVGLLIAAGSPASSVVGGGLAAVALGALVAAPLAVLLAAAGALAHVARRRIPRYALIGPFLAGALSLPAAWFLLDPDRRAERPAYIAITAITGLALGVSVWLASAQPRRLAVFAAALLAIAAAVADVWLAGSTYLELHDVAHLVVVGAALAALADWRASLHHARPGAVALASIAILSVGLAGALSVDAIAPGWRATSLREARHVTRLSRALRMLVDRDRDGFSPIAWGGDCDDGNARRHPRAPDPPGGGDDNCNGADAPTAAGAETRGLAPATGTPHMAPGTIDLVLLVTIDTLRGDAVFPELMPELTAFGARGATFERAYAAGSHTRISLPMILRASDDAPWLASILTAAGVEVSALCAGSVGPERHGFSDATAFKKDAAVLTDAVLDRLAVASERPRLFWVHYYDPHRPWQRRPELTAPNAPSHWPISYRDEVRYLDRELGRLFAGLDLSRTAVVITSDHGEGFGEHNVFGHGRSGYDEVVRVPAILVAPGVEPGRYPQLVTHRDIPATVLGIFGREAEAHAAERFGRSWLRVRDAPDEPLHEFVVVRSRRFSSGLLGESFIAAIVDDRYKLVAGLEQHLLELFDLREDPAENVDRMYDQQAIGRALWHRLAVYCDLDRWPPPIRPGGTDDVDSP